MLRTLDVKKAFAPSAGRGISRPRVRRTAAEVGADVHEALSRIPFCETGRTSFSEARRLDVDRRAARSRLHRLLRADQKVVMATVDYEAVELAEFAKALQGSIVPTFAAQSATARQFAKKMNFGLAGGISPAKFAYGEVDPRPPLAMAKPNDWREAAFRRAAEAGAFEEVLRDHKYRPSEDQLLRRAVADRVRAMTGRTLHRKSWAHAAAYVWDAHRALEKGWNVGGIAIPRLRWDDAADERDREATS